MPEKFDRCVQHVKEQGGKANPYAVCHASLGKEFTKEDQDKLGQILKGLNEIKSDLEKGKARRLQMLGYAKRHQEQKKGEETYEKRRDRLSWMQQPKTQKDKEVERKRGEKGYD